MLLGPPKSKAGRRVVGVPDAIIPVLRDHLPVYVKPEPGALVLTGVKGGPLRRGNFSKMSAWPHVVASIGMAGLHFHDLRHLAAVRSRAHASTRTVSRTHHDPPGAV